MNMIVERQDVIGMAGLFDYPTPEDFSDKIYAWLLDNDEGTDWEGDVTPDGRMLFDNETQGVSWTVSIDDDEDDVVPTKYGYAGETMWVNMLKFDNEDDNDPDYEALEFSSVEEAVAGVGRWMMEH